jgi:chromosome segregation ATPase
MKNPLQNLLIFLSLCLCAFITFQWHRETKLRQNIQTLTDSVQDKLENLQSQQTALKRADEEIKRLEGLRTDLTETVKSNRTQIARLMKDLEKSDQEVEKGLKQIEVYKGALQQANDAIKRQNEDVKKQNEDLKRLATEHGETVAKYNKLVGEFNDLAQKWNAAQAAAAAAATNAPPKK